MTGERRLAFQLALASGYWVFNPEAMLANMPWRIWRDWKKFLLTEPLPAERADMHAAMLASVQANVWARKPGQQPFRMEDFLLRFGPVEPARARTPDELHAKMLAMFPGVEAQKVDVHTEAA